MRERIWDQISSAYISATVRADPPSNLLLSAFFTNNLMVKAATGARISEIMG